MQLHKGIWIVLITLAALVGCKRLTFIKPNYDKMEIEQVKQAPDLRDSPADKRRMVAADSVEAAANRLSVGDYEGAERAAQNAVKNSPDDPTGYSILGLVQQGRGNSASAGSYFQKAASMGRSGPAEWGNYGSWLCESGQATEGLTWIDRALQYPDALDAAGMQANAGKCALKAGNAVRAEQNLRSALSSSPTNAVALDGMTQLMIERGQTMEARAFSERRLAQGESAESLQRAILIETKLGDTRSAQRYRDRLSQLNSSINNPR
ncbi:type IV pilus biogenesis/stability protein PilW [Lysobacter sp. HDW10]|uniref:type IV pilus biogenesis/stability protein PilW n=1 Tax=Lysobacter sp. HDW10 TaxID=2714936 RepID=UPI00140E3A02|nr:type IV pilus biogenesis/stability protein PilW [Lysobacter sp. HDW10]QIK81481.1 type IV pilus biogenesis/stability protein PilW [Lysobacter sp. HDW10]